MGMFPIIAILAAQNARNLLQITPPRKEKEAYSPAPSSGPNKYGDQYREEIIKKAIKMASPSSWFGWFSICPLNDVQEILGAPFMGNDAYRLLDSYHCVNYFSIPREIRKRLPELIREALTPPQS